MDAQAWDERYAQARQWSAEPNRLAAELIEPLPPGRALDLAAGEGRMALWLAGRGWEVEALDFSRTALERGRQAAPPGATVTWRVDDAVTAELGEGAFDVVLVLYLHMPRDVVSGVLRRAARAVAPGGRLLLLGHDRANLDHGVGGPQDPEVLWDVKLLAEATRGFRHERVEQVRRDTEAGAAIDTLLWGVRA
ncbi:MAG: class I SAM-dependent methyltransferase [Actinomycetes bacterium]